MNKTLREIAEVVRRSPTLSEAARELRISLPFLELLAASDGFQELLITLEGDSLC